MVAATVEKPAKRKRHPFMSDEAFEEAVRVWEAEFVPTLTEEQSKLLSNIGIFMRDTIGWKHYGRLVGTGNPHKD